MREIWIKIEKELPLEAKSTLIQNTVKYCDGYIVEPKDIDLLRQSGANRIASKSGGDILLVESIDEAIEAKSKGYQTIAVINIKDSRDLGRVSEYAEIPCDYIAIKCSDWKVIPVENLIAQIHGKCKLLAFVSNVDEAKLMLETLEIGVDGVVIEESNPEAVESIYQAVRSTRTRLAELEKTERLALLTAKVVEVKQIGSGARVCVDTCELMREGEGMLVGCQSSGLFLVQAEVLETPYVAPRPFRVNAGPVAQYVLVPGGKTRYLSELKAGDEVLIVDREGRMRNTNVCRVKVEWRPMLLIEAENKGRRVKAILQNAETIRLVTPEGHKSVTDLKAGDEILVHVQEGGRHFGTLVKEERVIEV